MKLILIFITILPVYALASTDFSVLKERFAADFKLSDKEASSWFVKEIPVWISSQTAKGSWPDINYRLDDNKFTPGKHPARMDYLAKAYRSPGHKYFNDKKVLRVAIKAYDYWIKKPVNSYNWWHNTIGVPNRFMRTMILLEDELGPERIKRGIRVLNKAVISKTGQNRLWYSEIVFVRSLFTQKERVSKTAASEFYKLLNFNYNRVDLEGVQADLSFHQHGALLYNGGYGSKFSLTVARLISILSGSKFEFPKNKLEEFTKYILDSQVWMTRSNKWDYSVTGREITRKNKTAEKLIKVCDLLKELEIPRKKEFEKCYNSLTKNENYLIGNKGFWRSDYMVHHRKNFFSSVRMYSERMINNDAPSNSEGLMSHYLADGANYVMMHGDEYHDIFPVWNWNFIPGTTTEVKKLKPAYYEPGNWGAFAHIRYLGNSRYVGTVSNGDIGMSTMSFKSNKRYENVDARKSWMFLDDGLYGVGSHIRCRGCKEIVTTVEQKNLRGKVLILHKNNQITEHTGSKLYRNIKGASHDGISYHLIDAPAVMVKAETQSGKWNTINGQYSSEVISKKVFSLLLMHENNIDEAYAYGVFPGLVLEELSKRNIQKVTNDKDLHAVSTQSYEYISFYKQERYEFDDDSVEADRAIALIIDKENSVLYVSDPTQRFDEVNLIIGGRYLNVKLPRSANRGKSVRVEI